MDEAIAVTVVRYEKRGYTHTENTAHHNVMLRDECPVCGHFKPLTEDYFGEVMCSDCLVRSLG